MGSTNTAETVERFERMPQRPTPDDVDDAFAAGRRLGHEEAGGVEVSALLAAVDALRVDLAVSKAIRANLERQNEERKAIIATLGDPVRENDRLRSRITELEKGLEWRPMTDAPRGVPILCRHRGAIFDAYSWMVVVRLTSLEDEEDGCGADIIHYNGTVLLGGFHGVWGGWRPLEPAASRLLTEGAK